MKRAASFPVLEIPSDKTITTLYLGNIVDDFTKVDMRDQFYLYGEIRNVTLVPKQQCLIVKFTKRSAAETELGIFLGYTHSQEPGLRDYWRAPFFFLMFDAAPPVSLTRGGGGVLT